MQGLAETSAPVPLNEQVILILQLLIHLVDVFCHYFILVWLCIDTSVSRYILLTVILIMGWSAVVSSCYIAMGQSSTWDQIRTFFFSATQVQLISEARKSISTIGESDYFQTLRMLQAILEAAPWCLVYFYLILASDANMIYVPDRIYPLMITGTGISLLSLASGVAFWEQKVCKFAINDPYLVVLLCFRFCEITSRVILLALVAVAVSLNWLFGILIIDFMFIVLVIAKQGSVQFTYSLCVSIPLTLISVEPLIWRREDHAVPKDIYFPLRVAEFIGFWYCIAYNLKNHILSETDLFQNMRGFVLLITLALYLLLPIVWKMAKVREQHRNMGDCSDDDMFEDTRGRPLHPRGMDSDEELAIVKLPEEIE